MKTVMNEQEVLALGFCCEIVEDDIEESRLVKLLDAFLPYENDTDCIYEVGGNAKNDKRYYTIINLTSGRTLAKWDYESILPEQPKTLTDDCLEWLMYWMYDGRMEGGDWADYEDAPLFGTSLDDVDMMECAVDGYEKNGEGLYLVESNMGDVWVDLKTAFYADLYSEKYERHNVMKWAEEVGTMTCEQVIKQVREFNKKKR